MYLLDTNIVSDMIRKPRGVINRRVRQVGEGQIVTSIVVAGEVRYGAEHRGWAALIVQMELVLGRLSVLPLESDADRHYGILRADLERRGRPIGANDMLIAAHALSLDATLVTDNIREFERIDGLKLENWLRD